MTTYNVEMDDAKWARVKADQLSPERANALRNELNMRHCGPNRPSHQQGMYDGLGAIARAEHGARVAARQAQNLSTR